MRYPCTAHAERHPQNIVPCQTDLAGRCAEREFFIDNLLARIHFIIVMIRCTGFAPWEFESPFPGSLTSTFLVRIDLAHIL